MNFFSINLNSFLFSAILIYYIKAVTIYLDVAEDWQLGFQDPATPIMEGIINLHHDLMFFLCVISIFVT